MSGRLGQERVKGASEVSDLLIFAASEGCQGKSEQGRLRSILSLRCLQYSGEIEQAQKKGLSSKESGELKHTHDSSWYSGWVYSLRHLNLLGLDYWGIYIV